MALKPLKGPPLALLTISLALAIFMNILDTTITNVSIPTIAGNLSVSPNMGTWTITSFMISTAIFVPLTGWLARRFGEVRLFVTCTALFSVTSWLCGMAPDFFSLVIFRSLQGAVAGPMIPLSQSILLQCYPPDKKGLALAFWSMTAVIAPIFGPMLGGYITDNYGWPWIFFINIPVGFLSSYVTWNMLKGMESETVSLPIDKVGLFLLFASVGSFQVMLDRGRELDWFSSPLIFSLAIISLVAFIFFIVWESKEKHPVVDLSLFTIRNYLVGTLAISIGFMTFFSGVVIIPLWLQTQMGYTATWAGFAMAPMGILTFLFTPIVGKNMHRLDLRLVTTLAFFIFSLTSFWQASFNTGVSYWQIVMPRFVQGLGMAMFFVPLTAMSLTGLPPERLASATGLTNFMRILGGSFGTSISITLWDQRNYFHQSRLGENINWLNPVWEHAVDSMRLAGMGMEEILRFTQQSVIKQSVMLATNDLFWIAGWIFMALTLTVWMARGPFLGGAR